MAGKNLSARALYYMTAQMSANAVGFITASVLARAFTKGQMGDYQQLMMLYALFSGVLIMGLPQSLTYFYAVVEERHRPATVYFVTGLLFLMGLVLGLATYAAAPLVANYFKNVRLTSLVRDFFLFYAFTMGGSYLRRLSVVTNRYVFLMFWLPFDRLLMLLSFAVPALLGYSLATTVRVAVVIAGVKFAITTAYTLYVVPINRFEWTKGLAGRILYYSIPLGLSSGIGQISQQIDRLVIGRFMSTEFFAVFSLGTIPIPIVPEIAESVMTVLIPVLAGLYVEKNCRQFAAIWQESIRKTAIFILAIFGFVEFFALPCMVLLYGPAYAESALYFRISQVGLLFKVTMYGAVLQALGQTRQIFYVFLTIVCVKPFTNIALFKLFEAISPGMGPVGPPIGTVLAGLLSSAYFVWFIKKSLGVKLKHLWPLSSYLKTLSAATIAGLAASAVLLIPHPVIVAVLGRISSHFAGKPSFVALVQLALGAAIFLPSYGLLLHAFGALKGKDWELLKDMTYRKLSGRRKVVLEKTPS